MAAISMKLRIASSRSLKKEVTVLRQPIVGVAYDGDADRALFVDEKGNVVDGDATLWILARGYTTKACFPGRKSSQR